MSVARPVNCVVFCAAVWLAWGRGGGPAAAEPLPIVKAGKAAATIVVQPTLKERMVTVDEFTFPGKYDVLPMQVAKTLQSYLARMTGAELPIQEKTGEAGKPAIHVGLTDFVKGLQIPFDKHDRDTILLRRVGDQVVLVGVDDWGSEMAVNEFLERVCGIRWFMPGPLGEVVPKTPDLSVGDLDVVESPSFLSRMMSGVHIQSMGKDTNKDTWDWMRRVRLRERYKFHHNIGHVIPPATYGAKNPEYFPFVGGKRAVPASGSKGGWQPCFSNPDVLRISVDTARAFFDEFPRTIGFSLGQNDNWGFCECDACRKMNEGTPYDARGKRNYSPVYFDFLNRACAELEKTHPGRKLGSLIYVSGTMTPPPFKLHPNAVGYIPNDRSRFHYDPVFRKHEEAYLSAWAEKGGTLGIYEWHFGSGFLIPHLALKSLKESLSLAYDKSIRAYYGEEYPNWGLEGPRTYITARLLWDIRKDPDALLDDYCRNYFQEAATPMRHYYDALEEIWNSQPRQNAEPFITYLLGGREQFALFPPSVLNRCARYLADAAALAKDATVQERVRTVRHSFQVTEYYGLREFLYQGISVADLLTPETFPVLVNTMNSMHYLTLALRRHMNAHIINNPYTFHEGLCSRRGKTPRPNVIPLDSNYCDIGAQVAGVLARLESESRKGEKGQAPLGLTEALLKRFEEVSQLLRTPDPQWLKEAEGPAWETLDSRIRMYLAASAVVPRLAAAPVIDGTIKDGEWGQAPALGGFQCFRAQGKPKQGDTTVRIGYDDQALYVAYRCQEEDVKHLIARCEKRDTGVWDDDAADFVVLPAGTPKEDFRHYIINAIGALYDARGSGPGSAEWNGTIRLAVGKDENTNTWTVETAIPHADLGKAPAPGEVWRAQFGRINSFSVGGDQQTMEFSSWCFTPSGFNNADYLGVLLFQ